MPDDTTLALWLDDELDGEELARVDAWAANYPDQLAAREEIRRWRNMINASVPSSEEPPAPEFFNERILHSIRDNPHTAATTPSTGRSWGHWWMPMAACAGMAVAFWLGMNTTNDGPGIAATPTNSTNGQHVYTPEQGVEAEFFTSSDASASVIVLTGVDAIPDSIDFSKTVSSHRPSEINSTAVIESPHDSGL